ncbi:hypothetical protein ACJZ2D_015399 [Fusarium nematophilum]
MGIAPEPLAVRTHCRVSLRKEALGTYLGAVHLTVRIFGRTSQRLRNPVGEVDNVNSDCILFCGIQSLTMSAWIFNSMKRGEIREKLGIEGSGLGDCCTSCWCLCCALVQQDKEVKARQLRHGPGVNVQGYQPVGHGMQMSPSG